MFASVRKNILRLS